MNKFKKIKTKKWYITCSACVFFFFIFLFLIIQEFDQSYAITGTTYGISSNDNTSNDLDIIAIDPDPCNSSVSGDAVLLVSDGYVMLMDTGHGTDDGTNDVEYVSDYVIKFLQDYQTAGKLKGFYMYFSHFHADHYGLIYRSIQQDGTCQSIEGLGNVPSSFSDKSGKFVDRLKQTIGESKIKEIYVSDVNILKNIVNSGENFGENSIGYYRNNYEYLTQTFCEGETTTVEDSESGCTVYPVDLCKEGSKVKIVNKGDRILLGDATIDIIGPNYINTLDFSNKTTPAEYKSVFTSAYPICDNIPSGKRNYKTTNITCTVDGKTRYDFSVQNTGSETVEKGDYLNDSSLVSLVTVGNTRYLSTGDIEWQEIEKLASLKNSILPSGKTIDIMKVPHHAEKTGFLESLYTTYQPKFAFYQQNNATYGGKNWSKYVVDYVSANTNLLATGYNGTIKYKISNDNINIENESYVSSCTTKESNSKTITVNYIDSNTMDKVADSSKYVVAKESLGEEMTATNNYYENETHDYDGNYNLKGIADKNITGYTLNKDLNYELLEGQATDNTELTINLFYEKETYTVTFNSKGGSSVSNQIVAFNELATKPTNPTKTGYTFKEWTLGGVTYDFATKVTSNITLEATWTANNYTVTFDSDGGSAVSNQTVAFNGLVTKPTNPTKDNYAFKEWTLNGETYDFATKVTSDITLKAIWTINKYTVTFDSDGGSKIESQIVASNGLVEKPDNPTKDNYAFKEWTLDGETYDFTTKVTKNITLKATWTSDKYTVKFDSDGGSKIESQIIASNGLVEEPDNPTKTGYTFKEWVLDGEAYDFETKVTSDITLTAIWEINQYTVIFNSDGGSSIASQEVNYKEKATTPKNPTKEGYIFEKWLINNKDYDFSTPVTKDITLTAKWKLIKYTVNLSYKDTDNNVLKTKVVTITDDETFDVSKYQDTIPDYKFIKLSYDKISDSTKVINVDLYYVSKAVDKISVPNTLKNARKYIAGALVMILGIIISFLGIIKTKPNN